MASKDLYVVDLRIEGVLLIEDLFCSTKKRSSVVKHQMLGKSHFLKWKNYHGLQLMNFDDKFQFMDVLW